MTEEQYSNLLQGTEPPPFVDPFFQEMFREAFRSMLHRAEFFSTFENFRIAYEYRRRFPWLAESRESADEIEMDGLTYALRAALATYIAPFEREHPANVVKDTGCPGQLDTAWEDRLSMASEAVIEEDSGLKYFEKSVVWVSEDAAAITPAVLRKHIAAALVRYHERHQIGTASDPI